MNKWIKFISFLMASLFTVSAAHAGKENDTLVWVTKFEPPTYNYYDQTLREGVILSRHIWDSLYWRDLETGEFKPHLATKMEYSNPTTIDITLRKDIVFHNGEKFDADDVVFTINEIINPENKYKNRKLISWAKKAEKTGQYSVRLHLGKIFAPAMEMLSTAVVMYPDEYYKKVGKNGFARAPVGTGPYKAAEIVPGKHLALERNESYFGGAKGKANISKVLMRFVDEPNTQIAELMSGNADLIWRLNKEQGKKLNRVSGVSAVAGETMRVGYLQFDSSGSTGDHPLKNIKVRQAISHAIDRESIAVNLQGGGQVLDLFCYPTQVGCESPDAPKYKYDPAKAKQLLAEAGYPNGFEIDFYAYRNRYFAEAMMGFMAEVGIKAIMEWMKYSALRDKVRKDEVPFNFMTWGSGSVNDVFRITSYFFNHSSDDLALDPDVKKYLDAGDGTIVLEDRKKNYSEALRLIAERAHALPLFSYAYYYGMSDDLDFKTTPDEIVHLYRAKWK